MHIFLWEGRTRNISPYNNSSSAVYRVAQKIKPLRYDQKSYSIVLQPVNDIRFVVKLNYEY